MRYYCPECKTETITDYCQISFCNVCGNPKHMIKFPDFETPGQYEKRTGKKLNDGCLVWNKYKRTNGCEASKKWVLRYYGSVKEMLVDITFYDVKNICAVVDVYPEPPPDDFVPEEM